MAPHGKVLVNASIRHRLCKNDSPHLSKASRKQSKKESPTIIRINEQFWDFQCLRRGHPHTLSSERDFKSLVSASLRQSQFLFVVSFDFSLRERFFLRKREGFAFFWQDNITTFFAPCQSCKIVSSCHARSSERPGPGASAGAFALPRCAPQGEWWGVRWWVDGCIDGRNCVMGCLWFLKSTFEVIGVVFDVQTDLTTSYLWYSLLFICPAPTLPPLSPAVHLL